MEYLSKHIGSTVLVTLKGGTWIRGIFRSYDAHLNLILDDAEEIIQNGESGEHSVRKLGKVLIRGDTVVFISPV